MQNNREIIEDIVGKHNVSSYFESDKKITFDLPIFQIPVTLLIAIQKMMNLRDISTNENKITIYKRR